MWLCLTALVVGCWGSHVGGEADAGELSDARAVGDAGRDGGEPPCEWGEVACTDGVVRRCDELELDQGEWTDTFDCEASGLRCASDGSAACESASDGTEVVPVELEVLWLGYYQDTSDHLPADRMPYATIESGVATVVWPAVVYEACMEPDGYVLRRNVGALSLELVDWGTDPACNDTDFVAEVRARIALEPGTYTVTLTTSIGGFWYSTPAVAPFELAL